MFEFRTARSDVKVKLDAAIHTAYKKEWAKRVPKACFLDKPVSHSRTRLLTHKNELIEGDPYQLRHTKHGAFVIFKRHFPHRARDKRLAIYIAVPIRFVIDQLKLLNQR